MSTCGPNTLLLTDFQAVVSNFHDGPCDLCKSDLGCPCYTVEELKAAGAYEPDAPKPDGTKSPRCQCTCGECYAPWGEVLDDHA